VFRDPWLIRGNFRRAINPRVSGPQSRPGRSRPRPPAFSSLGSRWAGAKSRMAIRTLESPLRRGPNRDEKGPAPKAAAAKGNWKTKKRFSFSFGRHGNGLHPRSSSPTAGGTRVGRGLLIRVFNPNVPNRRGNQSSGRSRGPTRGASSFGRRDSPPRPPLHRVLDGSPAMAWSHAGLPRPADRPSNRGRGPCLVSKGPASTGGCPTKAPLDEAASSGLSRKAGIGMVRARCLDAGWAGPLLSPAFPMCPFPGSSRGWAGALPAPSACPGCRLGLEGPPNPTKPGKKNQGPTGSPPNWRAPPS